MAEDDNGPSNIRVICRFRPINDKEKELFADKQVCEFPPDKRTVIINSQIDSGGPSNFNFDYVFTPAARQVDVYNIAAKPTVEAVMQGFNGTVFAYGQTSSGKTFTMTGSNMSDPEYMGIIPRMVSTVFEKIESSEAKIEFQVKVGYCEIYLEKIKDLLDTSKSNLKVHEDRTRGVYIADLTEEYASSGEEVYQLMKIGTDNREVAYTHMNAGSSRSHSIFILTITQTNSIDYSSKTGKLYLVDLAGSEKVGKTGAAGKRLEEAKNINKSLTMLGNVITALTDGKSSHVPYRDSKLTRVLQDSLGGNSKTSLIVTCSPSPFNEAETISTLRFGVRAKSIKNKPKVNREYTVNELKLMLAQAKEEILKKDRIIATMKKTMQNSGVTMIDEKQIKTDEDEYDEEIQPQVIDVKSNEVYSELIIEIEDLQNKLAEVTRVMQKHKNHEDQLILENEQLHNNHEFIYKQITELQFRKAQSEDLLREKEEVVEKLTVENELLQSELNQEIDKKLNIESQLNEKTAELESVSKKQIQRLSEEKKIIEEKLANEIENNKQLTYDIEKMEQDIKKNLNDEKKLKIIEDSHNQEKERWLNEKRALINELNARVKKYVDIQMAIDKAEEKYKALENMMPDDKRELKKRSDTLERNLEQLNLMYHQLVSQKSMLKVDKQVCDRKIVRLNNKNLEHEKVIKDQTEKIVKLEQENESLREVIKKLEQKSRMTLGPATGNTKIKKVIRGGGDNSIIFKTPTSRRTLSAISETHKEQEEIEEDIINN
ncbi:hypothetical protein SteCoe_38137 [Stentor coeruleus]|uniref:Kinesin-like protein n=1 Tax=Stentor coeruleus TaxID=5963 RepID=A0A1R2ALV4_9CILI|nr:hypothetical protein SteCoe_38137 [Stentor coeruleus]